MLVKETQHINSDGELYEGYVIKLNNADTVFFVVERTIMVPSIDEEDSKFVEEYVIRKLDGRTPEELVYNSNNETKRISFPSANAPMKVDHVFVVGTMMKSFV